MKYVIIENAKLKSVAIFSDLLTHAEMAGDRNCISAGFCSIYVNKNGELDVKIWGESISLNIPSSPEDNVLIKRALHLPSMNEPKDLKFKRDKYNHSHSPRLYFRASRASRASRVSKVSRIKYIRKH